MSSLLLSPPALALGNGSSAYPLANFAKVWREFLAKGGPLPCEYQTLNHGLAELGDAVRAGVVTREAVLRHAREVTFSRLPGTMQAQALARQFGYSGDFLMIDHIYTQKIHPDPRLRAWDLFFHAQVAPHAVRNRKAYFQRLMQALVAVTSRPLAVLNVASGPARDLCEFFQNHPDAPVEVDSVDMDARAIAHAETLCRPWLDRLKFHQRNVLRMTPIRSYDLVWSAGLFDYLNDRLFVKVLRGLLAVARPGGEVVIGNFSDFNPSRDYMELLGDWSLRHRSRETLLELGAAAGAAPAAMQVLWEPEGVNYFLHIQR